MKPISESLREKIDLLRKTRINDAEPSWRLDIFRDREKLLGVIQGSRITSGPDTDLQPSVAQRDTGNYYVVFSRGNQIYEMISSADNNPRLMWSEPEPIFSGSDPDIDFDGSFTTTGQFNTNSLMAVYENPNGEIKFRRRGGDPFTGAWGQAVSVTNGANPSIVRAWADPPEVGTQDGGIVIAFTRSGQLMYTHSDDGGSSWATPIALNMPSGGTKRNVQVFRLSDFTLGFIYEYDNGIDTEVWFLKTTRRYVNIASPDEVIRIALGGFRQFEFIATQLILPDETVQIRLQGLVQAEFPETQRSLSDETISVSLGGFRQVTFTGTNP